MQESRRGLLLHALQSFVFKCKECAVRLTTRLYRFEVYAR